MSIRSSIIVLALAGAGVTSAFAQSGAVFVGGEQGWIVTPPAASSLSAAQVQAEYLKFRAHPEAPDGGLYVGGEEGYRFPAHMYAMKDGKWVCIDKIPHNPPPVAIKSPSEQKHFQEQYPA